MITTTAMMGGCGCCGQQCCNCDCDPATATVSSLRIYDYSTDSLIQTYAGTPSSELYAGTPGLCAWASNITDLAIDVNDEPVVGFPFTTVYVNVSNFGCTDDVWAMNGSFYDLINSRTLGLGGNTITLVSASCDPLAVTFECRVENSPYWYFKFFITFTCTP